MPCSLSERSICADARSGCRSDAGGRQQRQQLAWEGRAGAPVLQADDASGGGVDLPQAGLGLLADDGLGVIALETQPGDVCVRVVMSVAVHEQRLAPAPERDDAG